MRRQLLLAVAGAAVAIGAACRTTASLPFASGTSSPTPTPSADPTPAITPHSDGAKTLGGPNPTDVCTRITSAAGDASVTVASANGLSAFDEVFVLQVQAPQSVTPATNTASRMGDLVGAPTSSLVGFHKFAVVAGVSGQTLTLNSALGVALATGPGAAAELCRVPVCDSLTIVGGGTLSASAWNGTAGGVVVFETAVLTVDGAIDASAAGFRAGPAATPDGNANCTDAVPQSAFGAGKGEGDDARWYRAGGSYTTGYAAQGLGGGGGNPCSSGGAGGGNGGIGGQGGSAGSASDPGAGGLFASASAFALPIFGGGGGGGGSNTVMGVPSYPGGAGGGLVWIRLTASASLAGAGEIRANGGPGAAVANGNNAQGYGGGGAGGTIVIEGGGASTFSGHVRADGGLGGEDNATVIIGGNPSPGGGGGGGRISLSATLVLTSSQVSVAGGGPGVLGTDPKGATAGGVGAVGPAP